MIITMLATATLAIMSPPVMAQESRNAKASAPIDLAGHWVSIVDEDWRYRLLTPPQGDYASVPINDESRKIADQWDPSLDGACEAYAAPAIMRMPTRLLISWEGDNVLKIETDAGLQTRRFLFDKRALPSGPRTWQGRSVADWEPDGSLKVNTTNLRAGWLRKNGVPYSENASVTEFYDTFESPDGTQWFVVNTVVDDPKYLTQSFITSTQFRKEPNGAKWRPEPCKTR
jgi:hypothetical protein